MTAIRRGVGAVALAALMGCDRGPDPAVIERQNEQRRQEYEKAKVNPPGLSAKEKQIRKERLEMEYGDLPSK